MKKILIAFIFIMMLLPLTSAFFLKDHIYWTLKGFEDVDSPITQLCSDKIDIVMDGNTAADVPILHYFDKDFLSYISTHTKGSGFNYCMSRAGTDTDLRCFCLGLGLHNTQDSFAHNEGGLVPKYLKRYFSSNLIGHMTTERDFQNKHQEYVKNDQIISSGLLDYYDGRILDNMFEQSGGDIKYLNLMNEISGLDMRNDVNIFANGYKGQGFYDTVYNKRVSLPWWYWGISFGFIIIGLGVALFYFILGKSNLKYIFVVFYILLALVGILILLSFYTNNTWQWVQIAVMFNPIRVSSNDIEIYSSAVQEGTNNFLKTGILQTDDNSGLSHIDSEGISVKGALSEAEKSYQRILIPIAVVLFTTLHIFLTYKIFRRKKNG